MVQWVKDSALSLQRPRSLLWHRFQPWPRNFYMPQVEPKKKKKKEKKKKVYNTFPTLYSLTHYSGGW